MQRYRITSPIRFFTFVFLTVSIAIFGIYSLVTFNSTEAATFHTYKQVVVEANDSLWSIAEEYTSESDDVRDMIDEIKEINELDSSELQVGDTLFVPIG